MRSRIGRVLLYSHDSYGLGHLRRCRAIANTLADRFPGSELRILSGSPVARRFSYREGVEVLALDGVTKVGDGEYAAADSLRSLDATLASRAAAIRESVESFQPDLLIVDKEPGGIRGETIPGLEAAKERGVRIVLGLRDVMDDPERLRAEWQRKQSLDVLRAFYDELWIFGLPQMFDPLLGIPLPSALRSRISYTGYLRREAVAGTGGSGERPYLVVTAGGGADGERLIDAVLLAYEREALLPYSAVVVLGPFMPADQQTRFLSRAEALKRVKVISFHNALDSLIARAAGVVAMGGYNTFCEVLSHDKRALLAPRRAPRMEQVIRTERAAALGLADVADEQTLANPAAMAAALRRMPSRPQPSAAGIPGLLDGFDNIERLVAPWLSARPIHSAARRRAAR